MGTRTINLSDAAYARLHALKKEGESFSDVVNRVTGKYALLDLIGILDDTEAEALRASTREFGQRMRRTMGPRTRG